MTSTAAFSEIPGITRRRVPGEDLLSSSFAGNS